MRAAAIPKNKLSFSESELLSLDERIEQVKQPQVIEKAETLTVPVVRGLAEEPDIVLNEAQLDKLFLGLDHEIAMGYLLKAASGGSRQIVPSFYEGGEVYIATKEEEDVTDTKGYRRAIHTISNYYNTLGIFRDDFDKQLNDKMARNAYYAIGE